MIFICVPPVAFRLCTSAFSLTNFHNLCKCEKVCPGTSFEHQIAPKPPDFLTSFAISLTLFAISITFFHNSFFFYQTITHRNEMFFIKHPHPFSRMFHSGKDSLWCLCNDISFLLSFVYKKFEWNDSYETSTFIFQNGTFWKRLLMMFPLISFPFLLFFFQKVDSMTFTYQLLVLCFYKRTYVFL